VACIVNMVKPLCSILHWRRTLLPIGSGHRYGGRVACIVEIGWTFVQQGQLCRARVRSLIVVTLMGLGRLPGLM
jgi:hypothetical protein